MSVLPLIPIGYPGESAIAAASQQKGLILMIVLLLLLGDLGCENEGNCTFEFFIQLFVLLGAGVFASANH